MSRAEAAISRETTLGRLVGAVLVEQGIADLFCIPGDFTMQLSRELTQVHGLTLRTMSHEYGTTLAALGYALGRRTPAAVCFTYGVGVLNAANGIAQAYVERVPLIVLSGAPGKREREAPVFLHHTVVDDDTQYRVMREITAHQIRISDPHRAQEQLREAVAVALAQSRPVYVEIPRDLYLSKVRYTPAAAVQPPMPCYDQAAWDAAHATLALLRDARRPVLVPGLEIKRYALADAARRIAETLALPWVASPMSRQVLPIDHPNYRGVYAGPASPADCTRDLLASCDALLLLGEPNADVNMGIASAIPAGQLVQAYDGTVQVGRQRYPAATADFVTALAELSRPRHGLLPELQREQRAYLLPSATPTGDAPADGALTPYLVIDELNRHFAAHPDTLLVADCGDAFFMSLGMHPADVLTSSLYMSMGIGVPGALGWQLGSGKRPLALVGDGAFHMTGQELMHARGAGISPIVIVLNNQRWTSLSSDSADVALTRLPAIDFAALAQCYGVTGMVAESAAGLRDGLARAHALDEPVLIDARIDPSQRSYLCERFFDAIKNQQHLPRV
ncbi:indolepyruvate/phenylpyruvate decarboxylase [Chitiniphilus shinanonensis]|uniref:Indolepyruvate/phenylpyruvate decarboxylase n=1 Tax=Chitiniphilus shinanonensis TaxID=553088 RepID=A0ABQ6C1F2_9NEIS|nr:thiamine pyrophosphate-dependent enzyme [Chitiniphilus shinanonensis]GLS06322.1 indolepyruvate/phenylpyruvate decarboxylase [Chitiniphilus shinanonensis]